MRIIRQILEGRAPGRSFTLNWKVDKHLAEQPWAALMCDSVERYESVIRALTDHLCQNPGNGAAYNNRAVAYWEIGELDAGDTTRRSKTPHGRLNCNRNSSTRISTAPEPLR